MEPTKVNASLGSASGKVIGVGVVLSLVGIVFILAPQALGLGISTLIGVLLIILGLLRIAFAWVASIGVLAVAGGVLMLSDPARSLQVLTVILAVYLLLDGISEILLALPLRPIGGMWVMLSGVVSIVLAIMIWRQWPASGEWALGVLVGVKLLVDGLAIVGVGAAAKAASS
jgi:uncharacterized membrane protein HdeD (DUF308 family)